ncbi:MAG: DUF5685 family protein [Candidatus Heimdallarchaeota archaeon]
MECLFLGVKTINCSLYQRCEGIYQIMLNLGAKKQEANIYSKYIWRRNFYNKLNDVVNDSASGLKGITSKILAKILIPVSKPLIRDSYGIEKKLSAIEKQLLLCEKSSNSIEPITYFSKSGEGYALAFQGAALLSKSDPEINLKMNLLGQYLGTLITMRDSIQDLERDRVSGSYNPFIGWDKKQILSYYHKQWKVLKEQINQIIKFDISDKNHLVKRKTNDVFAGLSRFANATTTPYGLCKRVLQRTITNNFKTLNPISYIVDPPPKQPEGPPQPYKQPYQQPYQRPPEYSEEMDEGQCRIRCCAGSCSECIEIPGGNPCGACCEGCDICVNCCDGCADCI